MKLGAGEGNALIGGGGIVALADVGIAIAVTSIITARGDAGGGRAADTADTAEVVAIHRQNNGGIIVRGEAEI